MFFKALVEIGCTCVLEDSSWQYNIFSKQQHHSTGFRKRLPFLIGRGADNYKLLNYQIAAVLKEREQTFLSFEAVTANDTNYDGGSIFLLTNGTIDRKAFSEQLKKDKIPTMQMEVGQYFHYTDVSQQFAERNQKAFDLAHLLLMYSLISIFLTCFGLFGMALYVTDQRTKEIGIRKVNGASARQIMLLLNRRFVLWIAIAFVIASPIAWLFLNHWLESYVYRVEISPATFLLAGLIVLLITLLTVSYHSYRAASTNPVQALRSE